jgi:hypothetical protein
LSGSTIATLFASRASKAACNGGDHLTVNGTPRSVEASARNQMYKLSAGKLHGAPPRRRIAALA